MAYWPSLRIAANAQYERVVILKIDALASQVTWGTLPMMVTSVTGAIPDPESFSAQEPGTAIQDIHLDRVFIGSCTHSRIEDLRLVAAALAGHFVGIRTL